MSGTAARLDLALLLARGGADRAIHLWVNACHEGGMPCSF
jgi:hypothetical protein